MNDPNEWTRDKRPLTAVERLIVKLTTANQTTAGHTLLVLDPDEATDLDQVLQAAAERQELPGTPALQNALAILARWEQHMDNPRAHPEPLEIHHADIRALRVALYSQPEPKVLAFLQQVGRYVAEGICQECRDPGCAQALFSTCHGWRARELLKQLERAAPKQQSGLLRIGTCDYCQRENIPVRGTPLMVDIRAKARMCKACWDPIREAGKVSEETDIGSFEEDAPQQPAPAVVTAPDMLPKLPPEVQRELDFYCLQVTPETVTVPRWWMEYLAGSSRDSFHIYPYIRSAYAAANPEPVDNRHRKLTPEDTIAELERREREAGDRDA